MSARSFPPLTLRTHLTRVIRWTSRCSVMLLLGVGTFISVAAEEPHAVAVEETWELVVATPDANSAGPQVSCAISPLGHLNAEHATFELNHQSLPTFIAGGIQLLAWVGDSHLDTHKFPQPNVMSIPGEQVRWTSTMRLNDGELLFEIADGESESWGTFGGQGYLRRTAPTSLLSLDNYNPAVSVANSGVTYAANRVQSLKLRRVRVIMSNGVILEDDTVRVVHELP